MLSHLCLHKVANQWYRTGIPAYDCASYGPLFAVSDEGSAGHAIIDAAYGSAKAAALPSLDPLTIGVLLDGERMTSAGEVPIGPDEYEVLSAVAQDRVLCTTNVGTRINARYTQLLPEFAVSDLVADTTCYDRIYEVFALFLHTPDERPRPLGVRLVLGSQENADNLQPVVEKLEESRQQGKLGPGKIHRLSVLIVFEDKIVTEAQIQAIQRAIDAAARAKLTEVAVDGALREAARKRLGLPSLLNVLDSQQIGRLLKYAHKQGVRLVYRYQLDVESAARTIWTGLHSARTQGFAAGKYGLLLMTLEEQGITIERLTRWCEGWPAIPAFYLDAPLVTADDVYEGSRMAEAARLWLKTARGSGATLVLFDCPDRITPRRLLKTDGGPGDVGVLSLDDIEHLLTYAEELGVRILWSGGITGRQAFELARRRVFGIFSTSSTTTKIAVTAQFDLDPRLPAENEPTEFGVRRIHGIIQGGFLSAAIRNLDVGLASSIESQALKLLSIEQNAAQSEAALKALDANLVRGWSMLAGGPAQPDARVSRLLRVPFPVPADAVRVFRGVRKPSLSHSDLVRKLETVFMPTTIQMQRLYGLTAYLPAVLPPDHGRDMPDEVALVFYRTQNAYHEAKRCVGGRYYSELHELVFDMSNSKSGFPQLFTGTIVEDQPYHLFDTSVDWQVGAVRLYVGRLRSGVTQGAFTAHVRDKAVALQQSRGGLDGVIFCVTAESLLWWEHAPVALLSADRFADITDAVFAGPPRLTRTPSALNVPYAGLPLRQGGDFVNMQFLRLSE